MLEVQAAGAVDWRMMSPDPDLALSGSSRAALKQFAAAADQEVACAQPGDTIVVHTLDRLASGAWRPVNVVRGGHHGTRTRAATRDSG
ncbi:MAG TPA: hypothetical protein VMK84_19165 [Streptosporangiaceae bacterium]|nr:hypothetical protein [Streptosporangiaceae bacterium]